MTGLPMDRRTLLQMAAATPLAVAAAPAASAGPASLLVIAEIVAKPGNADAIRAALVPFAANTRHEAGCISYVLYEDQDRPGRFLTYESWSDVAALEAHLTSPAMQSAGAKLGALLAQPPIISKLRSL